MNQLSTLPSRRVGLGCMALTGIYGSIPQDTATKIIRRALDLGVVHFDTAELYGPYLNEKLLSDALGDERNHVEIATKFGYSIHNGEIVGLDSRPSTIRDSLEGSLRRLRRDHVDVLYQHRPDPKVPIEDVVGTMSDLMHEGKLRSLGLSATDLVTLQRAQSVHPIAFVQNEFSLIARASEKTLLPSIAGSTVKLVCYSPLGRGILTGRSAAALIRSPSDYRSKDVRFQSEQKTKWSAALAPLWHIAKSRSAAPATVALAWLLSKGSAIRVIPGARTVEQLDQSVRSADLVLTAEELVALDSCEAHFPG